LQTDPANMGEEGVQKAGNGISPSCRCSQTGLWGIHEAMVVVIVMLPA